MNIQATAGGHRRLICAVLCGAAIASSLSAMPAAAASDLPEVTVKFAAASARFHSGIELRSRSPGTPNWPQRMPSRVRSCSVFEGSFPAQNIAAVSSSFMRLIG